MKKESFSWRLWHHWWKISSLNVYYNRTKHPDVSSGQSEYKWIYEISINICLTHDNEKDVSVSFTYKPIWKVLLHDNYLLGNASQLCSSDISAQYMCTGHPYFIIIPWFTNQLIPISGKELFLCFLASEKTTWTSFAFPVPILITTLCKSLNSWYIVKEAVGFLYHRNQAMTFGMSLVRWFIRQ